MRATQQPVRSTARRTWLIRTACGIASAALIAAINPAAGYAAAKPSVKLGKSTTAICSEASCPHPSPGNDIVAKVDLGRDFTKSGLQVTEVCLNFTFDEADPVDPGEELTVENFSGFLNIGEAPLLSRKSCSIDPVWLEQFQDGRTSLHIYAGVGSSFTVADLTAAYLAPGIS